MPASTESSENFDRITDLRDQTVKLLAVLGDPESVPAHSPQRVQSLLHGYVENLRSIHADCLSTGNNPSTAGTEKYFLFRATQEALAWVVDTPACASLEKAQKDLARALSDIEWYIGQFPKKKEK